MRFHLTTSNYISSQGNLVAGVLGCPQLVDGILASLQLTAGVLTCLQVGQDAMESTSGSLGTFELSGHTDTIASLAFSCQGTLLATGGMDGGWVGDGSWVKA
jgi:hypothetical protein